MGKEGGTNQYDNGRNFINKNSKAFLAVFIYGIINIYSKVDQLIFLPSVNYGKISKHG